VVLLAECSVRGWGVNTTQLTFAKNVPSNFLGDLIDALIFNKKHDFNLISGLALLKVGDFNLISGLALLKVGTTFSAPLIFHLVSFLQPPFCFDCSLGVSDPFNGGLRPL